MNSSPGTTPDDLCGDAGPLARAAKLHDQADELRKRGDALGYRSAEGKRLLRECRRLRMKAWALTGDLP